MSSSGISPSFLGLSRSSGWVTHVLLTRSRLCPGASPGSSLHLHVLSTPPAFVLSQDQTLREVHCTWTRGEPRVRRRVVMTMWVGPYTGPTRYMTGCSDRPVPAGYRTGRTWTHTPSLIGSEGAHAVEFSKTVAPSREGVAFERTLPRSGDLRCGPSSIAPGERRGDRPRGPAVRRGAAVYTQTGATRGPGAPADQGRAAGGPTGAQTAAHGRAARRACRRPAGRLLPGHADRDDAVPRSVVEVQQHDLLPGAQRQVPAA